MNAHGYGTRLRDVAPLRELWPEGYNPALVDAYARKHEDDPDAPLEDAITRQCLRCKARNCDSCLPTGDSTPPDHSSMARSRPKQIAEANRQKLLDALREYGPQTVYQLARSGGMAYSVADKHLDTLIAAGVVTKHRQPKGRTRVNIYTLAE